MSFGVLLLREPKDIHKSNVLMVTENSMELENQAFLSNQDITGEAPKLLLCSSIASGSDLGSNEGITPMAGIGKNILNSVGITCIFPTKN